MWVAWLLRGEWWERVRSAALSDNVVNKGLEMRCVVAQVGKGRNACIVIKLVGKKPHSEGKHLLNVGAFEVGI